MNIKQIAHMKKCIRFSDIPENKVPDIWHDASEEPQGDNWEILCVDDFDLFWVASKANASWMHNNWKEYAEVECVKMWAYTGDLLPKGSEN